MKKPLLFLVGFMLAMIASSAQATTKYYDSNWTVVPKEKAMYYADIVKEGSLYHVKSYWLQSGKLEAVSTYLDSDFYRGVGTKKDYYESGSLRDSVVYDDKGYIKTTDKFYESGKLSLHAFYDSQAQEMKGEVYDENGIKKPGYITYQKQAMFPGGLQAWIAYLQSNLKADVPTRKKAPVGLYNVVVSFLVYPDGKVGEVKAENDPGYGTAEEAVRVIKKGPDWIPAVQNNKNVTYRQRQPITFQVQNAK